MPTACPGLLQVSEMDNIGGSNILAVDDDPVLSDLMRRKMTIEGFEVQIRNSGKAALELLAQTQGEGDGSIRPVELVLLDVEMPDFSGFETLKAIREKHTAIELPVIMVTGRDDSGYMVDALEGGANDYVLKPVDFGVLRARMDAHLALRGMHLALRDSHRSLVHMAKMESVVHLAGGFAKEIRRPMAQIRAGLTDLKTGGADEVKLEGIVENMENAFRDADGIVSQLIASSSSSRLKLGPADLREIAEETVSLVRDGVSMAGLTVEVKPEGKCPPALVAREELKQVLLSIVLNAMQAVQEGGKLVIRIGARKVASDNSIEDSRIGARLHEGEVAACIELEDNGPGMNEEELQRAFDPFYKGRHTGAGSGLGLTVAKKLVELHGGIMLLENRTFGSGLKVSLLLRPKPGARL